RIWKSEQPQRLMRLFDDYNLLFVVEAGQHHLDDLALLGRDPLADVIGMNRQLAMAAIHKHGKLHSARTAEIHKFVERGAYRAARIENVVDEDDGLPFDAFRNLGPLHDRLYVYGRQIVSIERNVERAHRRTMALKLRYLVGYAIGQRDASP